MTIVSTRRRGCPLPVRLSLAPILLAACLALSGGIASAGVIQLDIAHYVVHVAARANFFDGALLTANDLNEEQSYRRSTDRYLQRADEDLADLFRALGYADAVLLLDEADPLLGKRTDVMDANDRYADDFILLNLAEGTWRGRRYLDEYGDIVAGVYDDLSGTFTGLTITTAEPATIALFAAGLAGFGLVRFDRLQRRTGAAL